MNKTAIKENEWVSEIIVNILYVTKIKNKYRGISCLKSSQYKHATNLYRILAYSNTGVTATVTPLIYYCGYYNRYKYNNTS